MRFLADESCDFRVVRALRAAGHDVMSVVDVALGADDEIVIGIAVREDRIFLTEDRDFGQLVYAAAHPAPGVILMRFPSIERASLPARKLSRNMAISFATASWLFSPEDFVSGSFRERGRHYKVWYAVAHHSFGSSPL